MSESSATAYGDFDCEFGFASHEWGCCQQQNKTRDVQGIQRNARKCTRLDDGNVVLRKVSDDEGLKRLDIDTTHACHVIPGET